MNRFVALLVAGSAVMLFACDPASTAIYPVCPFHWLTGLDCPVCGTLRGLHALLHGDLLGAVRCNALAIGALGYALVIVIRERALPEAAPIRPSRARLTLFLAITLGFTVVRNLPGGIGALMRP